jgi:VanZ family protein
MAWEIGVGFFSIRTAARLAGFLLLAAITFSSLSPASYRPVTAAGHSLEHFLVNLLLGLAFGMGHVQRRGLLAAGLVAFAGAIELAQLFVPGRHARLSDFLVDASSACLGVGLVVAGTLIRDAIARRPR